jgi:monoamine oxidase
MESYRAEDDWRANMAPFLNDLARILRIARYCEKEGISTREALDRAAAAEASVVGRRTSRRAYLAGTGKLIAAGAAASIAAPIGRAFAKARSKPNVGIVGAGMAGLVCGHQLRRRGIEATIYEAAQHGQTGGQMRSVRGVFPGQVAEAGAEFIDQRQKTILGYVKEFELELEDATTQPGDVFYYFDGALRAESAVVDEFRHFLPAIRADLRAVSPSPTAAHHNHADLRLDRTSLLEYLEGANGASLVAGPLIKEVIGQAYTARVGLSPEDQSSLNFLLSVHADARSKFELAGTGRYHVVGGSDQIAQGLADLIRSQIEFEMALVKVAKSSAGRLELTFKRGAHTVKRIHDAVVLAFPFTVLRRIELDRSLGIPAEKIEVINTLGFGTVTKISLGFDSRPWAAQGCKGLLYSDLPSLGVTQEANVTQGSATRGVLTTSIGGERGARMDPNHVQAEAERLLLDLNSVFPGAVAAASRTASGALVTHLENWMLNSFTRGHCSSYRPGQFTSIGGTEGTPVGRLHFAGEQTQLFGEWRETMEGAALSGIRAANEILDQD